MQLQQLYYLANQCPLAAGASVQRARSLLTLVTDTTFNDKTICEAQGIYFKKEQAASTITPVESAFHFSLLPNPAKDYVYVQCSANYEDPVEIIVTDYTGKEVYKQNTHFTSGKIRLETNLLANGVYLLKLRNNSGINYNTKFHVFH